MLMPSARGHLISLYSTQYMNKYFKCFILQKVTELEMDWYTANISAVKITVFRRVPFPAVIPLYYLHLITALSTVEKCKHRFTVVYYKIYTFTW